MAFDPSAYRVLGLRPGADFAAVEAAYRDLIKRYHPDRHGGNSERAAEVNRAYQQIRESRRLPVGRPVASPLQRRPRRSRGAGGRLMTVTLALGTAAFALIWTGVDLLLTPSKRPLPQQEQAAGMALAVSSTAEPLSASGDRPLDTDGIERAVLSAVEISAQGDMEGLARQSRSCHEQLRRQPGFSRLDQCVAFDEAAALLTAGGGLEEHGQFGIAAVTGRQLVAARLFPGDYLLLESRLDRIRARVEFSLAPPDPPPPPMPVEI